MDLLALFQNISHLKNWFLTIFWYHLNRKIKKTRENFEYKISQPSRGIKDYVEYIKYERGLMSTIKERIKQHKITTSQPILTLIADRMKQLYAKALSKFTQNIRFWDEYVKFLQTFKYTKDISSTFDRMLQVCLFIFKFDGKMQAFVRV